MIEFVTSGESHGEALLGIISGLPSNLYLDEDFINNELRRRQIGYGRSERMEIERDRIEILSGVAKDKTTGNPIALLIKNKGRNIPLTKVISPRPGHGDLVGSIKYNQIGARNILERTSARETAMRVALGAICKLFLGEFSIKINSHVRSIAGIESNYSYYNNYGHINFESLDKSPLRVGDLESEKKMIDRIDQASKFGDSLGGRVEIIVSGLIPGLGSYTRWERKLDALLSYSLLSIQGVKSVEIGRGVDSAEIPGSRYQDEIDYSPSRGYFRTSNNAGGIEAGVSNGEDIVLNISMKAIPTLRKGLRTVDMDSKDKVLTKYERSDICAVPSLSIVAENVVAFVLANEFLRLIGGDFLEQVKENYKSYKKYIGSR